MVMLDLGCTFKKGIASETRCITERTLTSIVWSKMGIVHVIRPFYTTTPWQRIRVSRIPPSLSMMFWNFYSIRWGSLRSMTSKCSFSLYWGWFVIWAIWGSRLSRSRTKRTNFLTDCSAGMSRSFLTTSEPTAPVAPVNNTLLPASLLLKSNEGR